MKVIFPIISQVFCLLLLFVSLSNQAQTNLDFDEVTVIAPYEPTIMEAFKTNFNPRIEDTLKIDIAFNYSLQPVFIPTAFQLEPITPARMRGEPLSQLYNGWLRAGMGSYTSPYLEGFYNTRRSNEYAYGLHFKHLSSSGGIKEYQHNGYSDNKLQLHGKRFRDNHSFYGDMNYEMNRVHRYGFREDDFLDNQVQLERIENLSKEDIRQNYHFVNPTLALSSHYSDSTKLNHSLEMGYAYLTDLYNATEHKLSFNTKLYKGLKDDPLGFSENQGFRINFDADYFSNISPELGSRQSAAISLTPSLYSSFKEFNFYVGLNSAIEADQTSHIRFYPIAGADVNLIKDALVAYASLGGGLKKHNLRDLSLENPFINTDIPLAFQNQRYEIKGGFKGSVSSFASYNISVSDSEIDNYLFFVTDFDSEFNNVFIPVYDDIRLFNFRAEVFSNVGERLQARFRADYYEFSFRSNENSLGDVELRRPWHVPSIDIRLGLRYSIQDKIILNSEAFARNSIFARIEQDGEIKAHEIEGFHVDISFGIEYRYTRRLSVFLNLNNVQNQPLERWYNYPSQKFNILGGASYAF